ncbi:uncharacterized protein LOC133788813 [Humulus lupulus]|uniref:uncharacterized protein LOC133788813 n=1 Tax=Humulus lupulus TaxID=3486 RepID=UPI002B401258|nr:uncharacterized protein LOC133788813 [Humulus lupulus]
MSIDKTWINNPNKVSDEYKAGVLAFVERASHFVDAGGRVKCPCNKCINIQFQTIDALESHLFKNGFLQIYTNWNWHGEDEIILTNKVVQQCLKDEMMDALNDTVQLENNKDEENKRDDKIPTTKESEHDDEMPTSEESERDDETYTTEEYDCDDEIPTNDFIDGQYYNDLFAEMEAPLFPGCEKYTYLNFLVKLMHFKVLGKIPNKIFDGMLELLQDAFPAPNKLPKSYYDAKMLLRKLGPAGIPETWLTTHHIDDKGSVTKDAKDNYEKLINVLETHSQFSASSSAGSAQHATPAVLPQPQYSSEAMREMMERIKALEEHVTMLYTVSKSSPHPPNQDPAAPSK